MTSKLPSGPDVATDNIFIPLAVPEIRGNEWKYLKECLDTNWVSSAGPFVDRFEGMVADYVGAKHGVATSSGTAALHSCPMKLCLYRRWLWQGDTDIVFARSPRKSQNQCCQ